MATSRRARSRASAALPIAAKTTDQVPPERPDSADRPAGLVARKRQAAVFGAERVLDDAARPRKIAPVGPDRAAPQVREAREHSEDDRQERPGHRGEPRPAPAPLPHHEIRGRQEDRGGLERDRMLRGRQADQRSERDRVAHADLRRRSARHDDELEE